VLPDEQLVFLGSMHKKDGMNATQNLMN